MIGGGKCGESSGGCIVKEIGGGKKGFVGE